VGRPPLPLHRKLERIEHGTLQGYYLHKQEPEIYGWPACDGCKAAWSRYSTEYKSRRRQQRQRLKTLLETTVEGHVFESDIRSLTAKELDVAIRMIRILERQLGETLV
jgi:hypothetical protein